jgi:CheY-like chemotaxis protein
MSSASRARFRVMSMVLVDPEPQRRSVMADAFRSAGCTVSETSTPLEAIVRLGELDFEPDLIAIADSMPGAIADDLRRFVIRDHPRVKLVTIGDELVQDITNGHWLSSVSSSSELVTRVREVLGSARRPTRL